LATELRFLQRWLPTVSLTAAQWGICILAATTVLVVDEGRKIIEQRRTVAPGPAVELEPRPAPEGPEQHRYQLAGYLLLAGIVATLAGVSADFTTPDQAVSQLINGTTNGWIPLLSSLLAIVVFPRFRRGKFPAIIAVSTVAFGALARVISVRTLEDVARNWGWWVALAGASLLLAATVLATVLRLANRRRDPLRRPRGLKQIGGVIALPIVIIALYAMGQILEIQETVSWPPTPDAITADTAQRTTELFAASNTAPADIKFDYAWSTAATVEPWPEGVEFYPRLFADIGQAKSSIHIIMFGWKPGDVSDDLVEILEAKRAEGVEVRAIVDAVGSSPYTDSVDLYRRLQAAGVEVVVNDSVPVSDKNASQLTLPPSDSGSAEIGRTDHRKLYVIDGTVAWTGGAGIEDHFRDGSFHDVLVRVTGDVVLQAQAVFLTSFASHDAPLPSDLGPYFPQQPLSGTTPIALVQTIPGGFSSAAQQVRQMIDQAED
ncbi:MAG: hypothetical protein GY939_27965, partial [Actinomycetia bacterium]|nr:hypothetical protein [Actinomycetes bacterium]